MNTWLLSAWLLACNPMRLQKRLDDQEFDHWYALRVYMSDEQKKAYLKKKTREERDAYLQSEKLWDKFYQYEDRIRDKIVAGEVQAGWTLDMLEMAWGRPYDQQMAIGRQAVRSVKYVYKFELHEKTNKEGQVQQNILLWEPNSKTVYKAKQCFKQEVIVDDNVIAEMEKKNMPC